MEYTLTHKSIVSKFYYPMPVPISIPMFVLLIGMDLNSDKIAANIGIDH